MQVPLTLLTLTIRSMEDVVKARQRARQISALLHFDTQGQTRLATSVSEIVRNAYSYAKQGKVEFCLVQQPTHASLGVRVSDKGPGINALANILANPKGGIYGARRIMDRFEITAEPSKGCIVWMEMDIPKQAQPVTQQTIATIVHELAKHRPESASEEVQQQNSELLHALELLTKMRDELELRVQERTAQLSVMNQELQQEIAERKQAEEWLRKHQQELAHVSRLSSMGEMGSALAHELNQPLTAIATFTQGCIRRLESKAYQQDDILKTMRIVAEQAERAGAIIHRMKDFVRKGKISDAIIDLNQVIEDTVILMTYETIEKPVNLQLDLSQDSLLVAADKIQIEQVLINLMRNAIEAMRDGYTIEPKITIKTRLLSQAQIEVNVIDNGPGFSADIIAKLLEPYFTTKPQGMGMGLSISRTIIETYGGRVLAQLNPLGGAWFQFILPSVKGIKHDND
jgi:C4-dicarboxylate-specific signal transduction histidine kinase